MIQVIITNPRKKRADEEITYMFIFTHVANIR